MLTTAIMGLANRSPKTRRTIIKWTFEMLAAMTRDVESWTLMNYGYADLDGRQKRFRLDVRDEAERYCFQLYHHAAEGTDLCGRDVVEVDCRRGGGASFVKRYTHLVPPAAPGCGGAACGGHGLRHAQRRGYVREPLRRAARDRIR